MTTAKLTTATLTETPTRRRPMERLRIGPPTSLPKVPFYFDTKAGTLVRTGTQTPVTWEEWNALNRHQRQEALRLVPAARRAAAEAAITMRARARAWVGAGLSPEARDRDFRLRLRHAARMARHTVGGSQATAATLAELAGGIDPAGATKDRRATGTLLPQLGDVIRRGLLRPGMVIVATPIKRVRDAADQEEVTPTWITYMGPDRQHGPRFASPASDAWTLQDLAQELPYHQVAWIADPYALSPAR